jgi:hypothetical protein
MNPLGSNPDNRFPNLYISPPTPSIAWVCPSVEKLSLKSDTPATRQMQWVGFVQRVSE